MRRNEQSNGLFDRVVSGHRLVKTVLSALTTGLPLSYSVTYSHDYYRSRLRACCCLFLIPRRVRCRAACPAQIFHQIFLLVYLCYEHQWRRRHFESHLSDNLSAKKQQPLWFARFTPATRRFKKQVLGRRRDQFYVSFTKPKSISRSILRRTLGTRWSFVPWGRSRARFGS